jgi:hypothetical protein
MCREIDQLENKEKYALEEVEELANPQQRFLIEQEQRQCLNEIEKKKTKLMDLQNEILLKNEELKRLEEEVARPTPVSVELLCLSIYQSLGIEFFDYDEETQRFKKGIASTW